MHDVARQGQSVDAVQGRKPGGWRSTALKICGVLGGLGLLVCLLLPAVRTGRPAAYRNSCQNQVKQIAVALLRYQDEHGAFPPAYTVDEDGKPLHSWRTLLLPYLEQRQLYESIDLTKPWDDPANAAAREAVVHEFACVGTPELWNRTTYLAVVGPGSCLRPAEPRNLADLTDGAPRTIVFVEVDLAHAVHWMAPDDADLDLVLSLGPESELAHAGGFHAAFADGQVSFLSEDFPATQRRALMSIAGDDNAVLDDAE